MKNIDTAIGVSDYQLRPSKIFGNILANIDYIRASDGVALNSEIQAWVAQAGVEIGASALGRVFTKLGLAHHKKGSSRGIRLDDETYEALSRRFRQYVQPEEELPRLEDFPSWDED